MFKSGGGGQDPSAGFGSSWVEGYIPGEYPGAQLVLNKELVNKLLLFSTWPRTDTPPTRRLLCPHTGRAETGRSDYQHPVEYQPETELLSLPLLFPALLRAM